MPIPKKTTLDEASDFYQIRIQPSLKAEFMRNCHERALNPSAVVRMLISGWNGANAAGARGSSKPSTGLFAGPSPRPRPGKAPASRRARNA